MSSMNRWGRRSGDNVAALQAVPLCDECPPNMNHLLPSLCLSVSVVNNTQATRDRIEEPEL